MISLLVEHCYRGLPHKQEEHKNYCPNGNTLRMKDGASDHYVWTIAINQASPRHTGTYPHPAFNAWVQRAVNTQYKFIF